MDTTDGKKYRQSLPSLEVDIPQIEDGNGTVRSILKSKSSLDPPSLSSTTGKSILKAPSFDPNFDQEQVKPSIGLSGNSNCSFVICSLVIYATIFVLV